MQRKKQELLSPAGDMECLRAAICGGADAVYFGASSFNARARAANFGDEELKKAIDYCHSYGKKAYVTLNTALKEKELFEALSLAARLYEFGVDAVICADVGLISLIRKQIPGLEVHISTQAGVRSTAGADFFSSLGATRVVLARELSAGEIRDVTKNAIAETEVFIHGALCMAYSGRCLLSGYLNHRDSNQGACTNSCRWEYKIRKAMEDDCGELQLFEPNLGTDMITPHSFMLEEAKRPGEFMPCDEDEHGTYIMNSKDLRALEHVRKLCEIGVDSLKIEGRTKSFYYCARTASVYRRAIDDVMNNTDHLEEQLKELESLAHRGYTDGFLARHPIAKYQNYDYGYSISDKSQFVGEVLGVTDDGLWEVAVRNRFELNDKIEILTPKGSTVITLDNLMNKKRENIEVAPGDGHVVYFKSPLDNTKADKAIIVRKFQSGETTRNTVVEK